MAKPQIVTGFFDDISEAQQAVQLLLGSGFSADDVDFSTKTSEVPPKETDLTDEQRSTGRFLTSLFGAADDGASPASGGRDEADDLHSDTTQIDVQVRSALEVDRAIRSLKGARSVSVTKPEAG